MDGIAPFVEDVGDDAIFERDSTFLRGLLPVEIWMESLNSITGLDDLENLSNSSLFFRNLLLPRRTTFLFPKVVKQVENKLKHEVAFRANYAAWLRRIQSLRLVCRQWSKGVDEFYENLPIHFEMNDDDGIWDVLPADKFQQVRKRLQSSFCLSETRTHTVQKFQQHFDDTHALQDPKRNPFFGRTVLFTCRDERITGEESHALSRFLNNYGHHIWFCTINAEGIFNSTKLFSKVKMLLTAMPNLKVVDIFQKGNPANGGFGSWYYDRPLERKIIENPLPTLRSLLVSKLNISCVLLLKETTRRNSHVRTLRIDGHWDGYDNGNIYKLPFPNLTQLSMAILSEGNLQQLKRSTATWNITKLNLELMKLPFICWSHVFTLLQSKWKNTLTHLTLGMPRAINMDQEATIFDVSSTMRLDLPRLTHLSLKMSNYSSLDFILSMTDSLEFLNVTNFYREEDYYHDHFALKRRENWIIGSLFHDNMWSLFKNMKRIKGTMLTRDMWPVRDSWERQCIIWSFDMTRKTWNERGKAWWEQRLRNEYKRFF